MSFEYQLKHIPFSELTEPDFPDYCDSGLYSPTDLAVNNKFYRLGHTTISRYDWVLKRLSDGDKLQRFYLDSRKIIHLATLLVNCILSHSIDEGEDLVGTLYSELNLILSTRPWETREEWLLYYDRDAVLVTEPRKHSDPIVQEFVDSMSENARSQSDFATRSRIVCALHEAYENDWFPIFTTLTCDSNNIAKVFCLGSKCYQTFQTRITRWLASEGLPRPESFAVTERGGKYGRLHIHVLFIFKDLPAKYKACPNSGLRYAVNRRLMTMKGYTNSRGTYKTFWPHGFSDWVPIRYGQNDVWAKCGWRWPVDTKWCRKTHSHRVPPELAKPFPRGSIDKVVGYLTKYVTKSDTELETFLLDKDTPDELRVRLWRKRITRSFGKTQLLKVVQSLPQADLETIVKVRMPHCQPVMYGQAISYRLLRAMAVRELLLNDLNPPTFGNVRKPFRVMQEIMRIEKHGRQTASVPVQKSFIDFTQDVFASLGGSEDDILCLDQIFTQIQLLFPPKSDANHSYESGLT